MTTAGTIRYVRTRTDTITVSKRVFDGVFAKKMPIDITSIAPAHGTSETRRINAQGMVLGRRSIGDVALPRPNVGGNRRAAATLAKLKA